jgi:carboxymethylenebutenolidase
VTTVTITAPDGPIDALLGVPEGEGPWPGVVVIHDAIGYGPDNESISRRIAAAGYLALTPICTHAAAGHAALHGSFASC